VAADEICETNKILFPKQYFTATKNSVTVVLHQFILTLKFKFKLRIFSILIIIILVSSSSGSKILVRTLASSNRRFRDLIKTLGRTHLDE
jgi:hypothetical protein